MLTPSRCNNFSFMGMENRRINIWNEAVLDPAFEETILDIMQGKDKSISVKFKSNSLVSKTPLTVLSNFDVFPNTIRFNSRYLKYIWKPCILLKKYVSKVPLPKVYGLLMLWAINDNEYDYTYLNDVITQGVLNKQDD